MIIEKRCEGIDLVGWCETLEAFLTETLIVWKTEIYESDLSLRMSIPDLSTLNRPLDSWHLENIHKVSIKVDARSVILVVLFLVMMHSA
jgi:hypothetical protein